MSKISDDYIQKSIIIRQRSILEFRQEGISDNTSIKFARNQIKIMEELLEYRKTGLTPEQIIEMDEEYRKLAKELGECKHKLNEAIKFIDKCSM